LIDWFLFIINSSGLQGSRKVFDFEFSMLKVVLFYHFFESLVCWCLCKVVVIGLVLLDLCTSRYRAGNRKVFQWYLFDLVKTSLVLRFFWLLMPGRTLSLLCLLWYCCLGCLMRDGTRLLSELLKMLWEYCLEMLFNAYRNCVRNQFIRSGLPDKK
jgi:hypothetical protein